MFSFPDKLKTLMQRNGYTQAQIAKEVGVSQTAVSHWLGGVFVPKSAIMLKLSKLFKIDVMELTDESKGLGLQSYLESNCSKAELKEIDESAVPGLKKISDAICANPQRLIENLIGAMELYKSELDKKNTEIATLKAQIEELEDNQIDADAEEGRLTASGERQAARSRSKQSRNKLSG